MAYPNGFTPNLDDFRLVVVFGINDPVIDDDVEYIDFPVSLEITPENVSDLDGSINLCHSFILQLCSKYYCRNPICAYLDLKGDLLVPNKTLKKLFRQAWKKNVEKPSKQDSNWKNHENKRNSEKNTKKWEKHEKSKKFL